MNFDWDEEKNVINIRKHKIDFHDVPEIFDGPMIVKVDDRVGYGEERWTGIGYLKNIITVVVFVETNENTLHIISARKANKYESKSFTEEIKNGLG